MRLVNDDIDDLDETDDAGDTLPELETETIAETVAELIAILKTLPQDVPVQAEISDENLELAESECLDMTDIFIDGKTGCVILKF